MAAQQRRKLKSLFGSSEVAPFSKTGGLADVAGALPPAIASVIGLEAGRFDANVGSAAVRSLRWALGSSPSWHVALVRSGAPVPAGRFRQPLSQTRDPSPLSDGTSTLTR